MNNQALCKKIGYQFKNPDILETALTHSSFWNENRNNVMRNNERLEFLGDAIFDAVISEYLFNELKYVKEGTLTKLRANIVCERSLAERAEVCGVGKYLLLGKGEERTGGRTRTSVIADAMEALIGAVFMDGGWEAAREMVLNNFMSTIQASMNGKLNQDYKTKLQERYQHHGENDIHYEVVQEDGPDHCKTFTIGLWMGGEKVSEGVGCTKKEAEQNAAKAALDRK